MLANFISGTFRQRVQLADRSKNYLYLYTFFSYFEFHTL